MDDKKRKYYTWIGVAIGIITFTAIKFFLFKVPSIDKQIMLIASEFNKTCPIMIDADTRLDNMLAQPGKNMVYNYTLVNMLKDSLNPGQIESTIKPMMIQSVKSHPDMEYQRKNKIILSYNYRDKLGEHVLQFKIGPNDYLE